MKFNVLQVTDTTPPMSITGGRISHKFSLLPFGGKDKLESVVYQCFMHCGL